MAAKSRKTGAAAPAIIATIMTAHIAKVNHTSAAVHGMDMVMPISAIIVSCSMEDDI